MKQNHWKGKEELLPNAGLAEVLLEQPNVGLERMELSNSLGPAPPDAWFFRFPEAAMGDTPPPQHTHSG